MPSPFELLDICNKSSYPAVVFLVHDRVGRFCKKHYHINANGVDLFDYLNDNTPELFREGWLSFVATAETSSGGVVLSVPVIYHRSGRCWDTDSSLTHPSLKHVMGRAVYHSLYLCAPADDLLRLRAQAYLTGASNEKKLIVL